MTDVQYVCAASGTTGVGQASSNCNPQNGLLEVDVGGEVEQMGAAYAAAMTCWLRS